MPKVPEEHLQARRTQILRAAAACFARHGVQGTTIAQICEAAELSPGAVYRYFSGKQAIIDGVFELALQQNAAMAAELEGDGNKLEALDQLFNAAFSMFEDPAMINAHRGNLMLQAEAVRDEELGRKFAEVQDDMIERIRRAIVAAQRSAAIPAALDAEYAARVHYALVDGFRLQYLLHPNLDPRRFVAAVRALLGD